MKMDENIKCSRYKRSASFSIDALIWFILALVLQWTSAFYLFPLFFILFFAALGRSVGQFFLGIAVDQKHRTMNFLLLRNFHIFYFTLMLAYFKPEGQVEFFSLVGVANSLAITLIVFDKSTLLGSGISLVDRFLRISFVEVSED